MPKVITDFVSSIIPPEHRTTVWRVLISLAVTGHVLWACSYIPGLSGFALASDVDRAQTAMDGRLTAIERKQDISLRITLAGEICRVFFLRADAVANPPLWEQLNSTFEQRQSDYAAINGNARYNTAECSRPAQR